MTDETKPPPPATTKLDLPVASEEKTDPGRAATVGEMKHTNTVTRAIFGAVAVVVSSGIAGGIVAGLALVRSEARAQAREEVREQMKVVDRVDAGMNAVIVRVATLEQQVPQLRAEVYEGRVETQEGRKDVRALQDVILSQRPSPRLERPLGPPPVKPPPPPPLQSTPIEAPK